MKDYPPSNDHPSNHNTAEPSIEQDILNPKDSDRERDRFLRQRIAQLEALFDHLPEAVIVTRENGHLLSFNRLAVRLLGAPPEPVALLDWPLQYGFYLDDAETHFPAERLPPVRALHGETHNYEEMILRGKGVKTGVWIAMTAELLPKDHNGGDGVMVTFRDITYRKQMELAREKEAARSEALYKLSRQLSEVGEDVHQVLKLAVVHAAEYIGDSAVATLTNEAADRVEISAAYHVDPKTRALLRQITLQQVYELDHGIVGGVVRSGEPLLIPSIAQRQAEAITLPAFSSYTREVGISSLLIVPLKGRGRVFGTLGLSRDGGRPALTAEDQSFLEDMARRVALALENSRLFASLRSQVAERQIAERALQESEERLRSIFDSSALGIKVLDLDGVIQQTNPALRNILGISSEELTGRHFTDFIHPDDVARSRHHLERLICGGLKNTSLEHRLINRDGEVVWVRGTFAGVKEIGDGEGYKFVVSMVENITESKKIAAELLEMKARLLAGIEMERLRLAQELHDGPMQDLHSTLYQLGGLRDQVSDDQQQVIDQLRHAIGQVIQELRATAKELRPPTIMDFGLEKAIRSHIEEFLEKYPDLKVELILASDRQLLAEDVRLALFRIYQQSMMNIVRHAGARNVVVRFMLDAEEVSLEIEDDGQGFVVPPRWVTFTRLGHFGLAGAAERVETLGGEFQVTSAPGKGAKIYVRIPIQSGVWDI